MGAINDLPDDEDEKYEAVRQREIDDTAEAKRRASGCSPEQLSLQDAFIEGSRAGSMLLSPSLNPYQDDTPEHVQWERGRHGAASMRAARMVA